MEKKTSDLISEKKLNTKLHIHCNTKYVSKNIYEKQGW